jgi:subtilisin family serine protease
MKKQIALFTSLVLVLAIGVVFLFPFFADETQAGTYIYRDTKILCTATLDDDFAPDIVLVTLTRQASFSNNLYTIADFSGLGLESVKDLTNETYKSVKLQVASKSSPIQAKIDADNFRKILELKLKDGDKEAVLETINKLEKRADIRYAGPSFIVTSSAAVLPTDDKYTDGSQWGLDKINAPGAWAITTGNPNNRVKVGVIDTGVDETSEDLKNQLNKNLSREFGLGYPYIPKIFTDDKNHGTAVAAIIGAEWDNGGLSGVCKDVEIVSLKYCGDKTVGAAGLYANILKAIIYATDNNISIINCSFGCALDGNITQAIMNYPGLIVAAAGNESNNLDGNFGELDGLLQLGHPNLISVGSTDKNDNISWFSNYGAKSVDIFAPGEDLPYLDNGEYKLGSGTSFAVPHVVGVAALIKSKYPKLTATQIKYSITNNVYSIKALEGLCITGGRLSAYKAMKTAESVAAESIKTATPSTPVQAEQHQESKDTNLLSITRLTVDGVIYEIGLNSYATVIGFDGTVGNAEIQQKVGPSSVPVKYSADRAF